MIDPFHLEAYNKIAINYNRDVEIYPVLNALFEGIYGSNPYKSPTDMGVNMVGFCISDDDVCCEASKNEIVRRYYDATNKLARGACNEAEISKIQMLFNQARIGTDFRRTTVAAKEHQKETGHTSSAIELEDGTIITAHSSELLGCSAALLLNVTKHLAGIDHEVKLIPQSMIELSSIPRSVIWVAATPDCIPTRCSWRSRCSRRTMTTAVARWSNCPSCVVARCIAP